VKITCSASSGGMRSILEFTGLTVRLGTSMIGLVYLLHLVKHYKTNVYNPPGKRTYEWKATGENLGNTSSNFVPFSIAILVFSECEQLLDSWETSLLLWAPRSVAPCESSEAKH